MKVFVVFFTAPAYEVQGKVMFSQVSVCSHFGGLPHPATEGYPIQGPDGGRVPHPRSRWGVPNPRSGWGVPRWGYPSDVQMGVSNPRSRFRTGWNTPHTDLGSGTLPVQDWMGYPRPGMKYPPSRPGIEYPPPGWTGCYPPPYQETEQHSKHLLCGGWYASCVHAGELSCLYFTSNSFD